MSDKLKFSFDNVQDVHAEIQDKSPQPSTAAIEAHDAQQIAQAQSNSENKDSTGTVFNPELHATDKDGNPSITSAGKFRRKRNASKVAVTTEAQIEQQNKQSARAAGQLAADMLVHSAVVFGGTEWLPMSTDGKAEIAPMQFNEHDNLRKAFADYFEAKNISDFPPGIALSIAVTAYAMPRLTQGQETKTKLAKAKIWIAERFNKFKRRSKNDAAQPDMRDNGKRKNDAGETIVQPKQESATRNHRT